MTAYIFPGQGSQYRGMGEQLFDRFEEFTIKADRILGYSIKKLCVEDPEKLLNKTQYTQPALYVVNAMAYYEQLEKTKTDVDYLAGHSLGEYNALLAAGCFDFETGLRIVKKRGELMSESTKGGMAAILNASSDDIKRILSENQLHNIDIANYNSPSQIVISGDIDEISKSEKLFDYGETRYYPLNTSGAFHSRFMKPASEKFSAFLTDFEFHDPKVPVISNVTSLPYEPGEIANNLTLQLVNGVRWTESIKYIMRNTKQAAIKELGPGDTLTKLVRRIKAESPGDEVYNQGYNDIDSRLESLNTAQVTFHNSSPQEKVNGWNRRFDIGTSVSSSVVEKVGLKTRTPAVVLFGMRPAVYLEGYKGYFDLDELKPIQD